VNRSSVHGSPIVLALSLLLITACDDDQITLQSPNGENEPPVIIAQGPEFPTEAIELSGCCDAPRPWVLAGDADGLDDIAAVFFSMDSIRIHDVIIRPGTMDGSCARVLIEPNNNIDTTGFLPLPVELSGPTDMPFLLNDGGTYSGFPFGVPEIDQASEAIGPGAGCASGPPSWLDRVTLFPPAVASPTPVFVTYMDVEFIGMSVTVYDKVGAKATATFLVPLGRSVVRRGGGRRPEPLHRLPAGGPRLSGRQRHPDGAVRRGSLCV